MQAIFSAPLQAKGLPLYVIYWNGERDWILVGESGEEFASMYRQPLAERLKRTADPAGRIDDAGAVERRIHALMAKPGKRAAACPPVVADYFSIS